jgi:hypothetical protein
MARNKTLRANRPFWKKVFAAMAAPVSFQRRPLAIHQWIVEQSFLNRNGAPNFRTRYILG